MEITLLDGHELRERDKLQISGQRGVWIVTAINEAKTTLEIEPYIEKKITSLPIDLRKPKNYGPPRRNRWS